MENYRLFFYYAAICCTDHFHCYWYILLYPFRRLIKQFSFSQETTQEELDAYLRCLILSFWPKIQHFSKKKRQKINIFNLNSLFLSLLHLHDYMYFRCISDLQCKEELHLNCKFHDRKCIKKVWKWNLLSKKYKIGSIFNLNIQLETYRKSVGLT